MSDAQNSNSLQETHSSIYSSDFNNVFEDQYMLNPKDVRSLLGNESMFETLGQIGNFVEDPDKFDYSYIKLIRDMQNKFNLLESLNKQNKEIEKLTKTPSQLESLYVNNQVKSDSLKLLMEARQQEILELLDLQIEDLVNFGEDIRNMAEKFPRDSKDNTTKSLAEQVERLQVNIAQRIAELRRYKEDISSDFDNRTVEESIGFIYFVNEKLTKSVEQMTTEMKKIRSEVRGFKFVTSTASSKILSSRDHV